MTLIKPVQDQFQDDCQSWLCCYTKPLPSSCTPLKLPFQSSCPLIGRRGVGLWAWVRPLPWLPASWKKQTFLSTNLASRVLALERRAAGAHSRQQLGLRLLPVGLMGFLSGRRGHLEGCSFIACTNVSLFCIQSSLRIPASVVSTYTPVFHRLCWLPRGVK